MAYRRGPAVPVVRSFALLLLFGSLLVPGFAQSGRRIPPKDDQSGGGGKGGDGGDVLQLGTQEVLLSVSVRDANNRPVTGLTQDDFIVAEDRVRQKIVSCAVASQPLNVVLLLDASGSVFSELASIRKAADAFVSALGPEDKVAIVQFAGKVELLQDWTSDRGAIEQAINWRYKAADSTSFWDAVYLAGDELLPKVEGPRAIVILSDGVDNTSKVTDDQARAALDRAACSVFVISKAQALIDRYRPYAGKGGMLSGTSGQARVIIDTLTRAQDAMGAMADRYGGRMFTPAENDNLSDQFAAIAKDLKQQYLITYNPENEAHDGRWRAIDIYLSRPGMTVRTRKGYVAE